MNWDTIEGRWAQLKGEVKGHWAKLTDDDLTAIAARRDVLIGKLQERYGLVKDDAVREVDSFIARLR
jgi:uncharacterized protein YjbJ (UPF0337 family)